jgi:hypothetical protein
MDEPEVIDLTQWSVLFPGGGEDISGSVYSGTFSVLDGSQVEDITHQRITHVEAYDVLDGDYAETDIVALAELSDGSWATVMAYCDTTGWDCQADAQWKWAPTRELAISQGLDREARRRLNVALPSDAEACGIEA